MTAGLAALSDPATADARTRFYLRHADRGLILSHRLQEVITHAPQLEEELALANIALDLLGQARTLYAAAAARLGGGLTEDDLALGRDAAAFGNPSLVEQPNDDFAVVMVRQLLHDLWAIELWRTLAASTDELLSGLSVKAAKETQYHVRHASSWVVALGDSTEEAHRRTQAALDLLWPRTAGLFETDPATDELVERGVVPPLDGLRDLWAAKVDAVLADATLRRPAVLPLVPDAHGPELAAIVAEMQQLHRAHPGASW